MSNLEKDNSENPNYFFYSGAKLLVLCPQFLCLPCLTKNSCLLFCKGSLSTSVFSQPNRTASRRAVNTEIWLGKGFQYRETAHLQGCGRTSFSRNNTLISHQSACSSDWRFSSNYALHSSSPYGLQINRSLCSALQSWAFLQQRREILLPLFIQSGRAPGMAAMHKMRWLCRKLTPPLADRIRTLSLCQ